MAEDLELLRLRAKAKLKLMNMQKSGIGPNLAPVSTPPTVLDTPTLDQGIAASEGLPEKPKGVFETAFPGVTEAKGLRKIPAAVGDVAGATGQLISASPFVAKAAFTSDPEKKKELALKAQTALRGESPGFFRSLIESPEAGAAAITAPLTGGLGLLGAGAVESGAGAVAGQLKRVGEDKPIQPLRATGETAAGALLPFGLSKGTPAVTKGLSKVFGRSTEGLAGVPETALRKFGFGFGKGSKELKKAAQTQSKIAKELVDAIDNAHNYLPEEEIIRPALDQITDVPTDGIFKTLSESVMSKRVTTKAREDMVKLIDELKKDFGEVISGQEIRDLRIRLDKEIGDKFGEAAGDFVDGIKKGRAFAQNLLIENAPDPRVAKAFSSEAEKFAAIDDMKLLLGKKGKTRELRTEAILDNLFGKNKTKRREMLQQFQNIFGGDFLERSEMARLAATLGPEGVPGFLPQQFTGRSGLGTGIGTGTFLATGNPFLAAAPALLSSPRVGAGALSIATGAEKAAQLFGMGAGFKPVRFPIQRGTTAGFKAVTSPQEERQEAVRRALVNGGN